MLKHTHLIMWTTYGSKIRGACQVTRADMALSWPAVDLDPRRQAFIEKTIFRSSARHRWWIHALRVYPTSVRLVVRGDGVPRAMLTNLKSQTTRQMRLRRGWPASRPLWADGGFVHVVRTEAALRRVIVETNGTDRHPAHARSGSDLRAQ